MKSLRECIEFIEDEISMAHTNELPMTAAGLEETLNYLLELEIIRNDAPIL